MCIYILIVESASCTGMCLKIDETKYNIHKMRGIRNQTGKLHVVDR